MVARQFLNQIVTFSVKFVQCDNIKYQTSSVHSHLKKNQKCDKKSLIRYQAYCIER
jgi:hypothetical protein